MLLQCSLSWQMDQSPIEFSLLSSTFLLSYFWVLLFPDTTPRSEAFNKQVLPKLQKRKTIRWSGVELGVGRSSTYYSFQVLFNIQREGHAICVFRYLSLLGFESIVLQEVSSNCLLSPLSVLTHQYARVSKPDWRNLYLGDSYKHLLEIKRTFDLTDLVPLVCGE